MKRTRLPVSWNGITERFEDVTRYLLFSQQMF